MYLYQISLYFWHVLFQKIKTLNTIFQHRGFQNTFLLTYWASFNLNFWLKCVFFLKITWKLYCKAVKLTWRSAPLESQTNIFNYLYFLRCYYWACILIELCKTCKVYHKIFVIQVLFLYMNRHIHSLNFSNILIYFFLKIFNNIKSLEQQNKIVNVNPFTALL